MSCWPNIRLVMLVLAISYGVSASAIAQKEGPEYLPSWEYTPYRMQFYLGSRDQSVPAAELETTLAALRPVVEREWRGSWQTEWLVGAVPAATAPAAAPPAETETETPTTAATPSSPTDQIVEIDLLRLSNETRFKFAFGQHQRPRR